MSDRPTGKWRRFFIRFLLPTLTLYVLCESPYWNDDSGYDKPSWWFNPIFSGVIIALFWAAVCFIRWLCCWRNFRRFLIVTGCFAALVTAFYLEENWRGQRAWENFKREWEAKGEKFTLAELAPPPVPDDQNFALTPIVASCWDFAIDRHGHKLTPPKTNVVNRLQLDIYRSNYFPTNLQSGNWQKSQRINLQAWQEYYRARFQTNMEFAGGMPVPPPGQSEPEFKFIVEPLVTNEFPVAPQRQTPAADVLLALSKFDSAIEEIRQASRLPYSRFPIDYDPKSPDGPLLLHLSSFKGVMQALKLRISANLQLGESEKALADVKLARSVTDSLRSEPFLVSHLVRLGLWELMLQPIWEGLAEHRWSDAQLDELERELAKLDFFADRQSVIQGEKAYRVECIERDRRAFNWQNFKQQFDDYSNLEDTADHWREFLYSAGVCLMPSGWYHQNKPAVSRLLHQYASKLTATNQCYSPAKAANEYSTTMAKLLMPERPWNFFVRLYLPSIGYAERKFVFAQSSADLARTAIALERYRLAHGNYPDSLAALAPQFLAQVPHDVIGGQPLRYRREANGQFTLYSIGWNETDDGGAVGLRESGSVDNAQGDWVWRYPAP